MIARGRFRKRLHVLDIYSGYVLWGGGGETRGIFRVRIASRNNNRTFQGEAYPRKDKELRVFFDITRKSIN